MKVAVFDLETTGLRAGFGRVLCGSVLSYPSEEMFTYTTDPSRVYDDRTVAKELRDKLDEHQLLVTWNGKKFDMPFLNTRLVANHMNRLPRKFHLDLIYYAKGWHGIDPGGASLERVGAFFGLDETKMVVDQEVWARANAGDPRALAVIVKRCESDVRMTYDVYWKLLDFVGKVERYGQ